MSLLSPAHVVPVAGLGDGRRTVTLVSGFLGSGKTTLLRAWLRGDGGGSPAVILNDFGGTMVDDVLLSTDERAPVVVSGGCACCTRRDELARALADLLDDEQQGRLPRSNSVLIETSGLSDPGPIAFTIAQDPVLKHHYALARICVTVDAVTGVDALRRYDVAMRQLLAADDVLVTKTDLVSVAQVEELVRWVQRLNPSAGVAVTAHGSVLYEVPPASAGSARPLRGPADEAHTSGIETLELSTGRPLDWQALAVWLSLLLHRHGHDVLRVKGVLDVHGVGPVALHGVQHIVHRPEHLTGPVPPGTRLVLIVRGLDPALVERSFDTFLGID
jgi:G3E family GTPase